MQDILASNEYSFALKKNVTSKYKSGDYTGVVPPVPIPNTEVKYSKADDSDLFRESR